MLWRRLLDVWCRTWEKITEMRTASDNRNPNSPTDRISVEDHVLRCVPRMIVKFDCPPERASL